jgi:hypothetical protein
MSPVLSCDMIVIVVFGRFFMGSGDMGLPGRELSRCDTDTRVMSRLGPGWGFSVPWSCGLRTNDTG